MDFGSYACKFDVSYGLPVHMQVNIMSVIDKNSQFAADCTAKVKTLSKTIEYAMHIFKRQNQRKGSR